jgi:hypothetical protein
MSRRDIGQNCYQIRRTVHSDMDAKYELVIGLELLLHPVFHALVPPLSHFQGQK